MIICIEWFSRQNKKLLLFFLLPFQYFYYSKRFFKVIQSFFSFIFLKKRIFLLELDCNSIIFRFAPMQISHGKHHFFRKLPLRCRFRLEDEKKGILCRRSTYNKNLSWKLNYELQATKITWKNKKKTQGCSLAFCQKNTIGRYFIESNFEKTIQFNSIDFFLDEFINGWCKVAIIFALVWLGHIFGCLCMTVKTEYSKLHLIHTQDGMINIFTCRIGEFNVLQELHDFISNLSFMIRRYSSPQFPQW